VNQTRLGLVEESPLAGQDSGQDNEIAIRHSSTFHHACVAR
jgi:hypothetical protein